MWVPVADTGFAKGAAPTADVAGVCFFFKNFMSRSGPLLGGDA